MTTFTATYPARQPAGERVETRLAEPLTWLRQGWDVLIAAPGVSATLGVTFTAVCLMAYAAAVAMPVFTVTFVTLVLAVSPFLAAAAYSAAVTVASGRRPTLRSVTRSVADRALSIGVFATLCGLVMAAWLRLAGLSFVLHYNTLGFGGSAISGVWSSGEGSVGLLVFLVSATAVLAVALFALAVIALPNIVDWDSDIVQAGMTGLRTIRANLAIVAAWSLILLAMISLAIASRLVLMPLVFPLLAYASWFCYAALTRE